MYSSWIYSIANISLQSQIPDKSDFLNQLKVRLATHGKVNRFRSRTSLVQDWTTHFAQSVLPAATERIGLTFRLRCHWHRVERWLSFWTKEWSERTVSMVMPSIRPISSIGCAMHSRNTWIVCARRSLLRQCAHLERRISLDQTAASLDHRTLLLHFICYFVSGFSSVKYNVALRSWQAAGRIVLFGGFTQFGGGASCKGNRWWVDEDGFSFGTCIITQHPQFSNCCHAFIRQINTAILWMRWCTVSFVIWGEYKIGYV